MKNRVRSLCILILGILLFLFFFNLRPDCLIKKVFHIPCPGCGMTHAFAAIFSFHIMRAFKYNILAVPLFLFLIVLVFLLMKDIIKGENKCFDTVFKFVDKYKWIIIILIIISFILNIIKDLSI